MNKYWKKKFIALGIFISACVFCEIITFSVLDFGIFPKYFVINLGIMLTVAGLILLVPTNTISTILYILVIFLQSVLSITNIILYTVYRDIFTIDLLALTKEAAAAMTMDLLQFWILLPFIALFAVLVIALVIVNVKIKNEKFAWRMHGVFMCGIIVVAVVIFGPFSGTVQANSLPNNSQNTAFGVTTKQNFESFAFKRNFLKSFGTYGLVYRNIITGTQPGSFLPERSIQETKDYFDGAEAAYKHDFGDGLGTAPDKDNNLIIVQLESFDEFYYHPVYTPTLWGLRYGNEERHAGINFTNYYDNAKTDVAEASVIMGSYPAEEYLAGHWKALTDTSFVGSNSKFAESFPFSMPNMLKDNAGFDIANYFHNGLGSIYRRETSHPAYGFDNAYFVDSFEPESYPKYSTDIATWRIYEKMFWEKTIDEIMPEGKRFFSFLTTVSGHLPYNQSLIWDQEIENFNSIVDSDFDDLDMSTSTYDRFKNGLSRIMLADQGVKYLLDELDTRGIADKTTLMFYCDHMAYGNNLKQNVLHTAQNTSENYRIPAFIWSPNVVGSNVDNFITSYDLTPTIFNFLGIDINPLMYLGNNAFDPLNESIGYSRLGGFIFNDKFFTDGIDIVWQAEDATAEDHEYFRQKYNDMTNRWSYVNNLFYPGNEAFFEME